MPTPTPHVDLADLDLTRTVAGRVDIRKYLPHRPPMEMVTAIVHVDPAIHLIVGYLDVPTNAFWVPGHFPGHALLPGVLMCEAAAQMCCYYTLSTGITPAGTLMGLGGIEDTRFRRGVRPGERLVLVGKGHRVKARMTQFNVQGYVDGDLAFHTDVIGVGLGMMEEKIGA